jgi:hypothetical protein
MECNSNTWFSIKGLQTITQTFRSSKPGDPLADVQFNSILTKVFRGIHIRLEAEGLSHQLQYDSTQHFLAHLGEDNINDTTHVGETAFMDDLVYPVFVAASNPDQHLLIENTQKRCTSFIPLLRL